MGIPKLRRDTFKAILPMITINIIVLAVNTYCLKYVDASLYQVKYLNQGFHVLSYRFQIGSSISRAPHYGRPHLGLATETVISSNRSVLLSGCIWILFRHVFRSSTSARFWQSDVSFPWTFHRNDVFSTNGHTFYTHQSRDRSASREDNGPCMV